MDIEFATNRLASSAGSLGEAIRQLGLPTGRMYIRRIGVLRAVSSFADLYGFRSLRLYPLIEREYAPQTGIRRAVNSLGESLRGTRFNPSRGDTFGRYAMHLSDSVELIVERVDDEKVRVLGVDTSNDD